MTAFVKVGFLFADCRRLFLVVQLFDSFGDEQMVVLAVEGDAWAKDVDQRKTVVLESTT